VFFNALMMELEVSGSFEPLEEVQYVPIYLMPIYLTSVEDREIGNGWIWWYRKVIRHRVMHVSSTTDQVDFLILNFLPFAEIPADSDAGFNLDQISHRPVPPPPMLLCRSSISDHVKERHLLFRVYTFAFQIWDCTDMRSFQELLNVNVKTYLEAIGP
jgi:hypothetical protein